MERHEVASHNYRINMKKIILLFMTLFLTIGVMQSQIKVGENTVPKKDAVLDLNGTVQGGLLLPNVNITDTARIPATFTDASVQNADNAPALAGMIVWNTNTVTGEGVYMWDGAKWNLLPDGGVSDPCGTPLTQDNPAAASICNGATRAFSLAAATGGSGTITYQWQQSSNNSTWANASGTSTNVNYTTPALTSSMYYRRTATDATCGLTHTSAAALVTVAAVLTQPNPAAASIPAGTTRTFSLGVASGGSGAITYNWQQSTNNSTWSDATGARNGQNYTTPALTSNMYYRRQATAATCGGTHNSASALVTVTTTTSIKVGTYVWAVKNLQGSGARGGSFVANIYNPGMFYQFNRSAGWASSGTVSGWNSTGDAAATSWVVGNDPCPTGYRVPTQAQLTNLNSQSNVWVASGNTITGLGGQPGRIYGPGATTTSFNAATQIFLPAVGTRSNAATIVDAAKIGYYWSSTTSGTAAKDLCFSSASSSLCDGTRSYGLSVRCVAE